MHGVFVTQRQDLEHHLVEPHTCQLMLQKFYFKLFLSCPSTWIEITPVTHLSLSKAQSNNIQETRPPGGIGEPHIVSFCSQAYFSLGDGWVAARTFLPRPVDDNSESAVGVWLPQGSWGPLLLAQGRGWGMILLTMLEGRQKWSSILSKKWWVHAQTTSRVLCLVAQPTWHRSPSQQYQHSHPNPELW